MSNPYKDRERGQAAQSILDNPMWIGAWDAYRARILEEIEGAASGNTELVMHLKRLLSTATAAKGHLERIMKEGSFAAKTIEMEDKKKGLRRVFG